MLLDFPKSRKEWDIAFLRWEKFGWKIGLGKSYCRDKFSIPVAIATIFKKEKKRSGLGDENAPVLFPRMRTRAARLIQTTVQKMALFLASSPQNSDLGPKKTDKDERKE